MLTSWRRWPGAPSSSTAAVPADGEGAAPTSGLICRLMADRYAFAGRPAPGQADVAQGAAHSGPAACELDRQQLRAGRRGVRDRSDQRFAVTDPGASPQIVAHDGRGPHLHVSRPTAPLADRMTAHFAMGLAWLVVAGKAGRIRSCESPTCRQVFVDFSRNRSRRYCDSRTCGNRLHVAAYRARKHGAAAR